MVGQASGEVCFLFTDVEGSTRLWAEHTAAMAASLARHDELVDQAISAHGGRVFSTAGDSFAAAFATPASAVGAAITAQTALQREAWSGLPRSLRVRMGMHRGAAHERADNYFGPEVNLAARVMSAAWGGQILCTSAVAASLGADPDVRVEARGAHRLRDIQDPVALFQLLGPSLLHDFPALRTLDLAPSTLPAQRSTFLGRLDDIATLRHMLLDCRLLTLTGVGGVGKTRLAIEVAGREHPRRADGTFFVDLSAVDGRVDLAATVAVACEVDADASKPPIDQLTAALADRECLVVFDNCEHVLDAAAETVDQLLRRCARVTIVATSREPLGVPGEFVHIVDPLDTAPGSAARALFVERAAAVAGGDYESDDPHVAELCARLEGSPLAIELAAARTRVLSVEQIVERLERALDLLAAKRRGTSERHQTLRATIEWSYRLLDDDERDLFDRLGVFSGSFDLAASASVGNLDEFRATDLLESLVLKSMVSCDPTGATKRRYRLLDTLRAFAIEQLQTRPEDFHDACDAHARFYLARLAALPAWRNVARDLKAEFEPDLGNILVAADAAGRHAVSSVVSVGDATEPLVYLLTNLGLFDEARRRCDAALAGDLADPSRGRLLVARAFVEATQDGTSDFLSYASRALDLLTPGDGVWSAALGLTSVVDQMFAPERAVPALQDALERVGGQTSVAADHDRAILRFYLGGALMSDRRYDDAAAMQIEAARDLEDIEPTSLIRLWAASGAAMSLTVLGQYREASSVLGEVTALAGWSDWSVDWFFARAYLHARRGNIDAARAELCTIGARFGGATVSPMSGTVVAGFAILAYMEGRPERARSLLELLTATRTTAATAVLYETIAAAEGWSDEDFPTRRIEHAMAGGIRQMTLGRPAFFSALGALLHEELAAR